MVADFTFMGENSSNPLVTKIDSFLMNVYRSLPFTYLGILRKSFGDYFNISDKVTLLDLGCGDGTIIERLKPPKNVKITGVDIFEPYLALAKRKKIYRRLVKADLRKFTTKKKFDIILASHVLEHFKKAEGGNFLKKIEEMANKRVIVATPIGNLPQDEYDENPHQLHRSSWSVSEMKDLGYKVESQGLKLLWGNQNIVAKLGIFSYIFFLISAISSPLLRLLPNLGTYMICYKDIQKLK